MYKGPGGALGFPHGTLLPRGRGQSPGCYALPAHAGYTNGAGQGLWSPSSLFGLWAAGLGPSGAVAGGQSTTEDPATHLDAGTQARSVVLDSFSVALASLCLSHFSAAPPFLVRLLLSNASLNREIQLSGCRRLFLVLAVKKLKKKKRDVSLPRNVSSCLRAAQGAPAGARTGSWRVGSHL